MSLRRLSAMLTLAVAFTIGLWGAHSRFGNGGGRFCALSRANHLRAKLEPYRFSPLYRRLSALAKADLIDRLGQRVERLEGSLIASGELVKVWFWLPNLDAQQNHVPTNLAGFMNNSPDQIVRWWVSGEDIGCLLCRPGFVKSAQSTFCCFTNRVPWGRLRQLGGSRDDVVCLLPGGLLVDLDQCQRFLNESIAAGFRVGVLAESDHPGHCVIFATRSEGHEAAQPGSEPNSGG